MKRRFTGWPWAFLIAVASVIGMMALSVLGVPSPETILAIRTADLPDVSRHTFPRSVRVTAAKGKTPTAIWLVRDGGTYRALSNQTVHPRACEVRWLADKRIFIDPCLGAVFDRTGLNVAGPGPWGLDAYPVSVKHPGLVEVELSRPQTVSSRARP